MKKLITGKKIKKSATKMNRKTREFRFFLRPYTNNIQNGIVRDYSIVD